MASSNSAEAMRLEIERLTAKINSHKQAQHAQAHPAGGYQKPYYGRSNSYVNPNYRPTNKYIRSGYAATPVSGTGTSGSVTPQAAFLASGVASASTDTISTEKKEVVLNGVAFESSGRSLVRKDLPKPPSTKVPAVVRAHPYSRAPVYPPARGYKPKARRGRARNMTLDNTSSRKGGNKKLKQLVNKPCPRFNTTGSCSRGLTCPYQHDPAKIAICWNFLQDHCPNSADTCNLSHDPTPERTPLCLHYQKQGRCTRKNCPFPHAQGSVRQGVCRDFAVLGYCEKGLDCAQQHVRECPDFAEKGTCSTKGCKLPHVIRANRNRKPTAATGGGELEMIIDTEGTRTAEDGQLGDEFISLTFQESDSEDTDEETEDEEDEEQQQQISE